MVISIISEVLIFAPNKMYVVLSKICYILSKVFVCLNFLILLILNLKINHVPLNILTNHCYIFITLKFHALKI